MKEHANWAHARQYKSNKSFRLSSVACILECLRVEYFPLPVGDMNSPSYNKFTEDIDFFWQATQTLGRAFEN